MLYLLKLRPQEPPRKFLRTTILLKVSTLQPIWIGGNDTQLFCFESRDANYHDGTAEFAPNLWANPESSRSNSLCHKQKSKQSQLWSIFIREYLSADQVCTRVPWGTPGCRLPIALFFPLKIHRRSRSCYAIQVSRRPTDCLRCCITTGYRTFVLFNNFSSYPLTLSWHNSIRTLCIPNIIAAFGITYRSRSGWISFLVASPLDTSTMGPERQHPWSRALH